MDNQPSTGRSGDLYSISRAAEMAGVGIQSLRLYEARGLVSPERTSGGTRRYSIGDVDRLRRIVVLLARGLNLAGIELVLALEDENRRLVDALEYRAGDPHAPR